MDKLTEETKNDVESLLDEYIVKKLDVSSELKSVEDALGDLTYNIDKIKKTLTGKISSVEDEISDEKSLLENSFKLVENNIKKNIEILENGINKVVKIECNLDDIGKNFNERFSDIEKRLNQNKVASKINKILLICFGTISVISFGILVLLFFYQFKII